jgi:predicted metal-dependent hydrolase
MTDLRLRDLFGTGTSATEPRRHGGLRRITLADQRIEYTLVRARRRTIGMQVGLDGLSVRASRWVTIREIESALAERAAWIIRALEEWRARRRDVLPHEWKSGAPILYLGCELALALHRHRRSEIRPDLVNLTVLHPHAHDPRQVESFVTRWLREETARILTPRVAELAARVGRRTPTVKLSNARSEWGSCNHDSVIRLNWRLVHLPPRLAIYVVAHEVAHLVELNHSPRFWSVVETLFPGHAGARRELDEWTALLEA